MHLTDVKIGEVAMTKFTVYGLKMKSVYPELNVLYGRIKQLN